MKPDLTQELEALDELPREELLARWREIHGRAAPAKIGRSLLILAIAYELQAKRLGGLPAATKRELLTIAGSIDKDPTYLPPKQQPPRPGTRLIREWGGETHVVTVLESKFEYRGQLHDSLSAIARLITGTQWSGPTFFGLKPGARTKRVTDRGDAILADQRGKRIVAKRPAAIRGRVG